MRRVGTIVLLSLIVAACAPSTQPRGGVAPLPPPYDLVISGGRVVDGTGAPWFYGDLAIRGDRIARVAPAGLLRDAPAPGRPGGRREARRGRRSAVVLRSPGDPRGRDRGGGARRAATRRTGSGTPGCARHGR